jgi:hypothetical protein
MNTRRTIVAIMVITLAWLCASAQERRSATGTGGPIPEGTTVEVRFIDSLNSETAVEGDIFRGTLEQSIVVDGRTLYPRGADVTGRVVGAHRSGRLSDPGELELALTTITLNGRSYPVNTQPFRTKGESHAKSNVTKIGGGTAAGAIIGAIAGGGKGAAIGAGVGAAAGTGVAAGTGKKEAVIESEAVLSFITLGSASQPATEAAQRDERYGPNLAQRDDRYRPNDNASARSFSPEFTREFSRYDRRSIRTCLGNQSTPAAGSARRDSLPPGLEKQLERNGSLPPGLQKRIQPLPEVCNASLPKLPEDWGRVLLGGRVLLLDPSDRIADMFRLDDEE